MFTTNAEDQRKAAELQRRLNDSTIQNDKKSHGAFEVIPSVQIDEGANKYVLISAKAPNSDKSSLYVTSKKGASYHRNAAEPFVAKLEKNGYTAIEILGGGRIFCDEHEKKISIFGYSYGFGRADHAKSKAVIDKEKRYEGFDVSWSNDGY